METMRESWTDARLDDFARNVDRRFDEVDRRFEEVDRRFDDVDRRFDSVERRMENGFAEMNRRFDSLQRTLLLFSGSIVVALIGLIATQL